MSRFYQNLDRPGFDYQLFQLPGIGHPLRGPEVPLDGRYGVCIGAAQTFGRFCDEPFPRQLGDGLGMPVLNMAIGGSGPSLYRQPELLCVLRGAAFVVAQVLSGRSANNSAFHSLRGGQRGTLVATGEETELEQYFSRLIERGELDLLRQLVQETRDDYARDFVGLLDELPGKTVLLWMSERRPDYATGYGDRRGLLAGFPHLIDTATLAPIRAAADAYVEYVSREGFPQRLWRADDAVTGTRAGDDGHLYNHYYPTPPMHAAVAAELLPVLRDLLG